MSMPRKKSRTLSVGGRHYRWKVNGEDYEVKLLVESQPSGTKLTAMFPHLHVITPGLVREVVEQAIAEGWDPVGCEHHRISRCPPVTYPLVDPPIPIPLEPPPSLDTCFLKVGRELRVFFDGDYGRLSALRNELLRQFPHNRRRRHTCEGGFNYAWDGLQGNGFLLWVSWIAFQRGFVLASRASSFDLARPILHEFLLWAFRLGMPPHADRDSDPRLRR